MQRRYIKYTIAVLIVGLGVWWWTQPGAEDEIRQILADACALAKVTSRPHPLDAAQQAKEVSKFFTEKVSFQITFDEFDEVRIASREEMRQKVMLAKTQLKSFECKFTDLDFTSVRRSEVILEATANFLGSMPGARGQFFDMHRVRLVFEKDSGRWLISQVRHLKNLRDSS